GGLAGEAVEVAAGQPDRRQRGGDRLPQQRLPRTHRPLQQQVPTRRQHGQDLELGLDRAEPGVEEPEPPIGHEVGQFPAETAHRPSLRQPHRLEKYCSASGGFGAPPPGGTGAGSPAGQPTARTPAGHRTAPSGRPRAGASSAGRQAVTVAPSPASRAASIAAATPIIASPIKRAVRSPSAGPRSTMSSSPFWRAGSTSPRSTSPATLARYRSAHQPGCTAHTMTAAASST